MYLKSALSSFCILENVNISHRYSSNKRQQLYLKITAGKACLTVFLAHRPVTTKAVETAGFK